MILRPIRTGYHFKQLLVDAVTWEQTSPVVVPAGAMELDVSQSYVVNRASVWYFD